MWVDEGGVYRNDGLKALGVAHGCTSSRLGDMKDAEARSSALRGGGVKPSRLRTVHQVHGRRVVNVRAVAWQRDPTRPIAAANAHFLLKPLPRST